VAFTFKQEPLMLGEVESLTLVTFLYSIKLFRVVYIFASFMFDQTTNSELDENRVNLCLILVLVMSAKYYIFRPLSLYLLNP
jgi:hypothetical protein